MIILFDYHQNQIFNIIVVVVPVTCIELAEPIAAACAKAHCNDVFALFRVFA